MFYFEDEKGEPFVVGMTPLGVLALKLDFISYWVWSGGIP